MMYAILYAGSIGGARHLCLTALKTLARVTVYELVLNLLWCRQVKRIP